MYTPIEKPTNAISNRMNIYPNELFVAFSSIFWYVQKTIDAVEENHYHKRYLTRIQKMLKAAQVVVAITGLNSSL